MTNSHIFGTQKGGVGKSFCAEVAVEALNALKQNPYLIEIESDKARMARLAATGRVRAHTFLQLLDPNEMMLNPTEVVELWDDPSTFIIENRPTIVDIGAQGIATMFAWLSLDVDGTPWGNPGGKAGEGLTIWIPSDASDDGKVCALQAATSVANFLPGARLVIIANRGAGQGLIDLIRRAVPSVEGVVIPEAPFAEIFHPLAREGLYALAQKMKNSGELREIAAEMGIKPSKMLVAAREINLWLQGVIGSMIEILKADEVADRAGAKEAPEAMSATSVSVSVADATGGDAGAEPQGDGEPDRADYQPGVASGRNRGEGEGSARGRKEAAE